MSAVRQPNGSLLNDADVEVVARILHDVRQRRAARVAAAKTADAMTPSALVASHLVGGDHRG